MELWKLVDGTRELLLKSWTFIIERFSRLKWWKNFYGVILIEIVISGFFEFYPILFHE